MTPVRYEIVPDGACWRIAAACNAGTACQRLLPELYPTSGDALDVACHLSRQLGCQMQGDHRND